LPTESVSTDSPCRRAAAVWFIRANVPDLLALGPPGAAMILLGFRKGARFMGRRHIG
jgi:hypothetical protein